MNLGVLISGRGSNMVALAQACARDDYPARIAVVVSNQPGVAGLDKAAAMGLSTELIDHRDFPDRDAFEARLIELLQQHNVQLVCLAGFMRLLSRRFIEAFRDHILNIHPSLLPSFPGLRVHEQALEHGVRISGCTVHLVTEDLDAGPILLQAAVPVQQDDSVDALAARILEQEHQIYPEAVRLFVEGYLNPHGALSI